MAELQRLTAHYKFGDFLDQALRDHLVCGLGSEGIQKKLLTEQELAVEMEAVEKNAKSFKGTENSIKSVASVKACHRCGQTLHDQKDRRFKDAKCHSCENVVTYCPSIDHRRRNVNCDEITLRNLALAQSMSQLQRTRSWSLRSLFHYTQWE